MDLKNVASYAVYTMLDDEETCYYLNREGGWDSNPTMFEASEANDMIALMWEAHSLSSDDYDRKSLEDLEKQGVDFGRLGVELYDAEGKLLGEAEGDTAYNEGGDERGLFIAVGLALQPDEWDYHDGVDTFVYTGSDEAMKKAWGIEAYGANTMG